MNLGIMQPYFFPYLGYFSLIKHTDRFILLDTVQFIRHGWIERNRILKPLNGWQYIRVPLRKFSRDTIIKDVSINNDIEWKDKILAQLQHYRKTAPYYFSTIHLLEEIFSNEYNDIVSLNQVSLSKVLEYLEIDKKIEVFSEINLSIDKVNAPDEWALNICRGIGNVDEYWNPIGGQSFFNKCKYDMHDIKLRFHSIKFHEYNHSRDNFEAGLSIIDVMMFIDIEQINIMLDNYELQ